jgi:hypothetical protein
MLRHVHTSDISDPSAAPIEDRGEDHRQMHSSTITNKEHTLQPAGKLACDICRERMRRLRQSEQRKEYHTDSDSQARSVVIVETRNVVVVRDLAMTVATRDERDIVQLKRICHVN